MTIHLESARYHIYKLICKFRVVVKHILRCYINALEYALIAKRHLDKKEMIPEKKPDKHIVPFSEEE